MKSLIDFISEQLLMEDIFNDNDGKLFEKYGSFNGCQCQAALLASIILDNVKKGESNVTVNPDEYDMKLAKALYYESIGDVFYNKVIILISYNKTGSLQMAYVKTDDNAFITDGKLNAVVLFVNAPEYDEQYHDKIYHVLNKQLIHELTHAYHDFNKLNNTGKSIFDEHRHDLSKVKIKPFAELLKIYHDYLSDAELNAYTAEIGSYVEDYSKSIAEEVRKVLDDMSMSSDNAFGNILMAVYDDMLKHSSVINNINKLIESLNVIFDNDVMSKAFFKEASKSGYFNDSDEKKIRTKIKSQVNKFEKRIAKHVKKLISDAIIGEVEKYESSKIHFKTHGTKIY